MKLILQTDQNQNISLSEAEEKFGLAKNFWDLERLYLDLVETKGKKLTPTEKEYLRGLLLSYRPQEIAKKLCKEVRGVRVALTNLYRYVQILCEPPECKVNCRNITAILESAGYKLPSSSQLQRKVFISCSPEKQTLKLAGQLYESLLAPDHTDCMTGQTLRLLTECCDRLDTQSKECDYFVLIWSRVGAKHLGDNLST
ncbi:MAG: hypothetical protein F6K31_04490 [Symploca sp. SIO2G7]|nr:hypothetical protein [Symploca sp. SIO2G7]